MDFEQRFHSNGKVSQVISKWSNGNIHFVVEYDDKGKWVDKRVVTFYIDSQIKSNHYYKNNEIEGEGLEFKNDDLDKSSASKKELIKFLNE